MEKVKVSKHVADAYETMLELGFNPAEAVELHAKQPDGWEEHCTPFKGLSLDEFIRLIYIGYEVEQTQEEKAIQWLIKQNCIKPGFSEHDIVMAIKSILSKGE